MDRDAKVKLAKKVIAKFQTKGMYPRWRVSDKMSDPYRASQAGLPLRTPMPAPLVYVQAHAHTLLTPYESEQVLVKMKEALNAAGFQCMLFARYGQQPSLNVLVDDASKVANWKPNPHYAADFIAPDTAKVVKLFSKSGFTDIHMKKLANPARRVWKVEFHPAMGQTARLRQIVERWEGKLNTTTFVATFAAADDAENAANQAADWGIAGRDTRRAKPKVTLVRRNPKDRGKTFTNPDSYIDMSNGDSVKIEGTGSRCYGTWFRHEKRLLGVGPSTRRAVAKWVHDRMAAEGLSQVGADGTVIFTPRAPIAKNNPRYDSGPYAERVKLPGWRSKALLVEAPAPRIRAAFGSTDHEAAIEKAIVHANAAARAYNRTMKAAIAKHGEPHPWVSGIGSDSFPEATKKLLRKQIDAFHRAQDAVEMHYNAMGKRKLLHQSPYAQRLVQAGNYGIGSAKSNPKKNPTLTPIREVGPYRQGTVSGSFAKVQRAIGFAPNATAMDAHDKVQASWGFRDALGRKAFVWCYKQAPSTCTAWSAAGSPELLREVFGDAYRRENPKKTKKNPRDGVEVRPDGTIYLRYQTRSPRSFTPLSALRGEIPVGSLWRVDAWHAHDGVGGYGVWAWDGKTLVAAAGQRPSAVGKSWSVLYPGRKVVTLKPAGFGA